MGHVNTSGSCSAGDLLTAGKGKNKPGKARSATTTLSVRLPSGLAAEIAAKAHASGQTQSGYILARLTTRAGREHRHLAVLGELIALRQLGVARRFDADFAARLDDALRLVRDLAQNEVAP